MRRKHLSLQLPGPSMALRTYEIDADPELELQVIVTGPICFRIRLYLPKY